MTADGVTELRQDHPRRLYRDGPHQILVYHRDPNFRDAATNRMGSRLSRGLEGQPSINLNVTGLATRGYLSERTACNTAIGRT